jgi:YD repeat-containing protein
MVIERPIRARFKVGRGGSKRASVVAPMLRSCKLLIGALAVLLLAPSAASAAECTDTWTGPSEGTWQTASNWSGKHVPNSSDVACIGSGNTVTVSEGTWEAGVVQGEGSLRIQSTLEVLSSTEASDIGSLSMIGGTLTGPATFNVSGSLTWKGASSMLGAGSTVVLPGATATVVSGSYQRIENRNFVNEGTFTISVGEIIISEGTEIINRGTFNANTEAAYLIGMWGAGGTFVNEGTVQKTSEAETLKVAVPFENKGTVDVQKGKLVFSSGGGGYASSKWESAEGSEIRFTGGTFALKGGSIAGKVTVASGATVCTEGVSGSSAQLRLEGVLTTQSGTFPLEDLTMLNGTLNGTATLSVSGSLKWEGESLTVGLGMIGSGSTVVLPGATASTVGGYYQRIENRRFVNEGTFTASTGEFIFNEGTEFLNLGTFNANSESLNVIGVWGSGGKFVNKGTIQKTAGTGTSYIEPDFENFGAIKESSGHLVIEHATAILASAHFGRKSCAGDPVDCATGNFSESQTDFAIGGLGVGLNLTRTYNAQAAATAGSPGAFGYGWTSAFSDHLLSAEEGKQITLFGADGGTVPFTKSGASFKAPSWSQDTLSGSSEAGYRLTLPDQTEYAFSGAGKLESVADRNGNETTLAYNEAGRLETITDPAGRELTFAYNGSGQVESIEDPMGHAIKYGYESSQLTSVTMPGEAEPRWQFKYDGSHRITKMTDGRGGKTINEYDGSSRVVSQTDPAERTRPLNTAPSTPRSPTNRPARSPTSGSPPTTSPSRSPAASAPKTRPLKPSPTTKKAAFSALPMEVGTNRPTAMTAAEIAKAKKTPTATKPNGPTTKLTASSR